MKVLIKRPLEELVVADVDNTLDALRGVIGGRLEHVGLGRGVGMLLDESGKNLGREMNFFLFDDVIVGTVIFVGESGDEFTDLNDEQIRFIRNSFSQDFLIANIL